MCFVSFHRQALDVQEKTYGPNHPSVATALHNLAVVLCLQVKEQDLVVIVQGIGTINCWKL